MTTEELRTLKKKSRALPVLAGPGRAGQAGPGRARTGKAGRNGAEMNRIEEANTLSVFIEESTSAKLVFSWEFFIHYRMLDMHSPCDLLYALTLTPALP